MAAAALYRSRGAAGVRAINGPFFIFTLLCLVGIATSLTDMEQVKLIEDLLKAHEQMESLKADYMSGKVTTSDLVNGCMSIMDQILALFEKVSKDLADDFPSLDRLLPCLKGFVENVKIDVEKVLSESIENTDQELRESWKLRELFEEQHAEL